MFKLKAGNPNLGGQTNSREIIELRKTMLVNALIRTCGQLHEAARLCEVSGTRMIDLLRYHRIETLPQEIRFRAMRRFAITDNGVHDAYRKSVSGNARKGKAFGGETNNYQSTETTWQSGKGFRSLGDKPHHVESSDSIIRHAGRSARNKARRVNEEVGQTVDKTKKNKGKGNTK